MKSGSTKLKYSEPSSSLFAMGYVDLIFKLKLTNKDLLKSGEDPNQTEENNKQDTKKDDRYYHIEDMKTIEDLQFLKDKKDLWDKITLSGGNDTIKQILIGNRIAKKKCKIEFFGFNRPIFKDNSKFFSDIFNYVCSKHNLIINETPLEDSARFTLNIVLYNKGESTTISLGTSYEEEEKERIKKKRKKKARQQEKEKEKEKENNDKDEDKKKKKQKTKTKEDEEESSEDEDDEDNDEEQDEDDYEETEAMKDKKIPKFRRASTILVKLNPTFGKYSMAYINFEDMKRVPGDFKLSDLNELLKFFKSKGTVIFVNFYKPNKPKIEVEEEPIDLHENDNEIMAEGKTKDNYKPEEQEEEPKDEKKEKKEPSRPTKKMRLINELYDSTNIFFFDTKQCIKMFNKHYENFTDDNVNNLKKITRAKIYDYFIKGIAPATKDEVTGMKTGLFMDQLNKLTLIFTTKKAANSQEFDCQPYPKINHNNMELIQQYRNILNTKKNDYYSVFISSIIIHCASYAPSCQSTDVIYPSFLISLEVIKKKIEFEKNDLEVDENIYKVKLDEKIIKKNLQIFSSGGKESGFVLDCTNKEKSTMKDYVSLYDYHLRTFFSSETIRKDLKNKGFINSEGFIMYDPEHRNIMRTLNKKKKKKKIISSEEIMDSIKGIDVPSNIKDKEIDAEKRAKQKNIPTDSRLPVNKELLSMKTTGTKKKKKRGKKNRGSSQGKSSDEWGSSDESDSGNNSGNNSGTVSGEEDDDENNKEKKSVVLLKDRLEYH